MGLGGAEISGAARHQQNLGRLWLVVWGLPSLANMTAHAAGPRYHQGPCFYFIISRAVSADQVYVTVFVFLLFALCPAVSIKLIPKHK